MATWHHTSIGGFTAVNINKNLEFLFGEKSQKYYLDEDTKTVTYLMRKEVLEGEKKQRLKESFEKYYLVKIIEV